MEEKSGHKRKRKKSFLAKARKYGKKGCYGRGSHIEEDTYQYFVRVMETQKHGFENQEDKENFTRNVFEQADGHEVHFCSNQLVSRVLEELLPDSTEEVLEKFMKAFSEVFRVVIMDSYASHVLQKLLDISTEKALKSEDEDTRWSGFVIKCGKFILNNLEEFIWEDYANHVARTLVTCLSKDTKPEFSQLLKKYFERVHSWPQLPELAHYELGSGFLQSFLSALNTSDSKSAQKLISRLLDEVFAVEINGEDSKTVEESKDDKKEPVANNGVPPKLFESMPATRLLESCIEVSSLKKFTQIYARIFLNRLKLLSSAKKSNLTVQKLVRSCREKTEFISIYDEIAPSFQDILREGFSGIFLSLAEGCKNHGTKQSDFMNNLMKALDCFEPELRQNKISLCVLKMKPFSEENLNDSPINLHGSLILQTMLNFNKPIRVVNSILMTEPKDLVNILSDPRGSYVTDAFVQSKFVGEKSRERLTNRLKGHFTDLTLTSHGSRTFDAIFNASPPQIRAKIASELLLKESTVNSTKFGQMTSARIKLSEFRHRRDDWIKAQSSDASRSKETELFADIIGNLKDKTEEPEKKPKSEKMER